jgi:hypothetical protein
MLIYEIPVIGETHLLKSYMDFCQGFEEPVTNVTTGSLVFSDYHKLYFYFVDDYNLEFERFFPSIQPYLIGAVAVFDWQRVDSLQYVKKLMESLFRDIEIPILYHALNIHRGLPFSKDRVGNGILLDRRSYLYFSRRTVKAELVDGIKKLIGFVSIQDGENEKTDN